MQLIEQQGKASLYRAESYNGNTNASVIWVVRYIDHNGKDVIARECTTRKEALSWLDLYKH
jgi:hypothetical protein